MKAQVFITQSEGGIIEVSVVREGLSSGAGHKYKGVEEARAVLLEFGFDPAMVDHQLRYLAECSQAYCSDFP